MREPRSTYHELADVDDYTKILTRSPMPFCRRDTAIQNCFSNTVIPSRSPFGALRRPATVSVLPSAESVYLRRTLNASNFHSTVNASPSHFAVALAEPEGNSTAVSFPSVVYFASTF